VELAQAAESHPSLWSNRTFVALWLGHTISVVGDGFHSVALALWVLQTTGSGCCALLAAELFPKARVLATDHLPEAVASTLTNAARFEALGLIRPGAVAAAEPGDLFDTVGDQPLDLIIFNAPWVAALARNRAATALTTAVSRPCGGSCREPHSG
jgi:hypothetical protein